MSLTLSPTYIYIGLLPFGPPIVYSTLSTVCIQFNPLPYLHAAIGLLPFGPPSIQHTEHSIYTV